MNEKKPVRLIFVCSGAADVGELTDRAARHMAQQGIATMSCLASIAARDPDITFNAQIADQVLLIDGCPQACARRTFEQAGLDRPWLHFDLSEVGCGKGACPVTPERILAVVQQAMKLLHV
jgi:uncharacterized metal-binding protein